MEVLIEKLLEGKFLLQEEDKLKDLVEKMSLECILKLFVDFGLAIQKGMEEVSREI